MRECKSAILYLYRFSMRIFFALSIFFPYLSIPSYTILYQLTRFEVTLLVDHSKVVTEDDVQQPCPKRKRYSSCLILRRKKYKEHNTFNTEKTSNALAAVKNKRTFSDTNSVDFDESLIDQYLISKPVRKKKASSLKDLVGFMQQILKCIQDRSNHPELFCRKGVLKIFCKIHRKTPVAESLF